MIEQIIFTSIPVNQLQEFISTSVLSAMEGIRKPESHAPESPIYATRKQVAESLGISLVTLNKLTKNGELQGYRIGGRVLYKTSEVDSALQAMQTIKNKG